jgi:hypothetical protein
MSDDARHVDMEEAMTDYTALFKEAARKVHPSWAITNYQAMETRNGMAFSCQLTANGNVVADVEQGGNGGATLLYWMKEARTDGTEQRRGRTRLELAELVGCADEHRVDRTHAAAHLVRRFELHHRLAHDDAHHVGRTGDAQRHH